MNVIAIVQARMGSTRLPGKVLEDIAGETMLAWVIRRARRARTLDDIVIATTRAPQDNPLVAESRRLGLPVFRGSEEDVLDRYYRAAQAHDAEVIVRLTADCPLLDAAVVDRVVLHLLHHSELDYVATGRTYPEGYGVEAFTEAALGRAWREAKLPSEREHVTPYIWKHPNLFGVDRLELSRDLSRYRVTVDEELDLQVVRAVTEALAPEHPTFGMETAVSFLREHPEIASMNSHIARQAGYWKSVAADDAAAENSGP